MKLQFSSQPSSIPQQTAVDLYFQTLQACVVAAEATSWPSQWLKAVRVESVERLSELIDRIMDPNSPLMDEVKTHVLNFAAGTQNARFWNLYFRSYDRIVAFSDDYIEVFLKASEALVDAKVIADLGSGTGNGSLLLGLLQPKRHVFAFDHSMIGTQLLKAKLRQAFGSVASPVDPLVRDITKLDKPQRLQGILMNNVLYAVPDKKDMLRRVFEALEPGSRLVLSDPHARVVESAASIRQIILAVMSSAMQNGSPMTEFDVAVIAAMNVAVLMQKPYFLTAGELKRLAEKTGFRFIEQTPAYYGSANLFVFERPA